MLPADYVRCTGETSVRGVPLPCCVKCQRRIYKDRDTVWMTTFKPKQINRAWECEGRIPYAE